MSNLGKQSNLTKSDKENLTRIKAELQTIVNVLVELDLLCRIKTAIYQINQIENGEALKVPQMTDAQMWNYLATKEKIKLMQKSS